MSNFTSLGSNCMNDNYYVYQADRLRGGSSWVFYNTVPEGTTYSITWPNAVKDDNTLMGLHFISRLAGDVLYIDFNQELTSEQLTALDNLYNNHVAPVPV